MPLAKATIPLAQGVDQRVDSRLAPAGVLDTVSGFRLERDGSLRARQQFNAVGTLSSDGNAVFYKLAVRDSSLVALGDAQSMGHPTKFFELTSGALTWRGEQGSFIDPHNVPSLSSVRQLGASGVIGNPTSLCCAQADIYVAAVWQDSSAGSNEVQFTVWEEDGGKVAYSTRLNSYSEPKLIAQGSTFFVFVRNSANEIDVHSFAPATDAVIQLEASDILNSSPTIGGYSVAYNSGQSRWGILITTSTNTIFEGFSFAFSYLGGFTVSNSAACPSLTSLGTQFFGVRHDVVTNRCRLTRISASTLAAAQTVDVSTLAPNTDVPRCAVGALTSTIVAAVSIASADGVFVAFYDPSNLSTVYQSDTFPNLQLAQAPCGSNSGQFYAECYLPVVVNGRRTDTERAFGVLSAYLGTRGHFEFVTSQFLAYSPNPSTAGIGASVYEGDRAVFAWPTTDAEGNQAVNVSVCRRNTFRSTLQVDGGLMLGGGAPVTWDGFSAHEVGWHSRPTLDVDSLGTAGSLAQSSTYFVTGVFSASDQRLRRDPSAPSAALRVDLTGGEDSITLDFVRALTMRGRSRASVSPSFVAFRTIANGSVPFADEVQSLPALGVFSQTGSVTLDQSDDALTGQNPDFERFNADDGASVLYSASTPEVAAPQPGELLAYCANRVFVCARGSRVVQGSKPLTPGEPVQFVGQGSSLAENFKLECPEPVEAMAGLDETLYLFSRYSVFVVNGNGPDRQGFGGFSAPSRLPNTGGCSNPESIVEHPDGLLANIQNRIMLFPRGGGAPVWVGEAVRDYFGSLGAVPRTVTSATLRSEGNEVVFFLDQDQSMALDLRRGIWTTDLTLDIGVSIVSAVEVGGQLAVCDENGVVYLENANLSYAGSSAVARSFSTHDFSIGEDSLGWGELHKVGLKATARGGGTIECEFSTDGGVNYTSLGTRTIPPTATLFPGSPLELFWTPREKKCSQFRLRFTMTNTAGVEGARMHAIRLEGLPAKNQKAKASERSDG